MTKLTYIYDTLCGWCFVAHPEISKLYHALPDHVEFEHHHAHLFTDENPFPLNEQTFAMIENVAKNEAPKRTGAHMSDAYINFLKQDGMIHASTLTAKAAAAAKKLDKQKSFLFKMAYQAKIFEQGADFHDEKIVLKTWQEIGGDKAQMQALLNAPEISNLLRAEKQKAVQALQMVGARGTPTLILEEGEDVMAVDPYNSAQLIEYFTSNQ